MAATILAIMMTDAYLNFETLLKQFVRIDPSDEMLIRQAFEPVSFHKAQPLVDIGKVAQHLFFISSGFARAYHMEDGDEITNHLASPGTFITAYHSFSTKRPSDECVLTITACECLRVTKDKLDELYRQSHNMAIFGLVMADQYLVFNNQRSRDLITLSAEQRYLKLMQDHPAIIQHVPLQHIASYIGVKPESLSRIRRQRPA